jgi:hypothetical protein
MPKTMGIVADASLAANAAGGDAVATRKSPWIWCEVSPAKELQAWRFRQARVSQSCAALNVSQPSTFPDFSPVMNQRVRCCEEPWVKASGTT